MFLFFMVSGGIYVCGLSSVTADYPHTVTRAGCDVNITMNPANVSNTYFVWRNGSVKLLVVVPRSHRVEVFNSSHTGYTTRIRYTGEGSLSQTGQLRFTIYNVTVQDAGTYYCQGSANHMVPACRQVLVVSQKPTTPTITGPPSVVSGENVTLTCSSSSQSLPPDNPQLTMTYTWRRERNGPDQIQFNGANGRLEAEEGKPITVTCSADCNTACIVTWWDTSRQRGITGQREDVLDIPAVDRSVFGQYTCHANNTHGNTSRNLNLEVFSKDATGVDVASAVPVAAVGSVLIVVTAVVVYFLFAENRHVKVILREVSVNKDDVRVTESCILGLKT